MACELIHMKFIIEMLTIQQHAVWTDNIKLFLVSFTNFQHVVVVQGNFITLLNPEVDYNNSSHSNRTTCDKNNEQLDHIR